MTSHFKPETFTFLTELKANNTRDWFQQNKDRFEDDVRMPALQFIADFGSRLDQISGHFVADPRPVGGSLFRIHRDIRFSNDKSPYKTHLGIRFFHQRSGDVHTPGFYLGIEPGQSMVGIGTWHPDSETLRRIREAIAHDTEEWREVVSDPEFSGSFRLWGESLKRPPKGYDPDHPFIEDLKRKDFVAVADLSDDDVASTDFIERYEALCRAGSGFVRYLCDVSGLPF